MLFKVKHCSLVSMETARALAKRAGKHTGTVPLLAVNHLAPATRDVFRKEGASWVKRDTGVCFLLGPGLLVDHRVPSKTKANSANDAKPPLRGRAGLVAESLLRRTRLFSIRRPTVPLV